MRAVVEAAVERVTRVQGVRGCLLIAAADGLVVAERLMDGVDGQAVAALTGSVLGRLARAAGSAGMRAPGFVHLRGEGGAVIACPAGEDLMLVAVTRPQVNLGLARLELLAAASSIA